MGLTIGKAWAETGEVRAAQQFGLSYLALMIMEDSKLVEKQFWTAPSLKDGVDRLPKGNDFRGIRYVQSLGDFAKM